MKYNLDQLWVMYREFCTRTQVGNENSVGAFLAYLSYLEAARKDTEARNQEQ